MIFAMQTYQITSQFLSKEWIMEKWDAGFYITAVAGELWGTHTHVSIMTFCTPFPSTDIVLCIDARIHSELI